MKLNFISVLILKINSKLVEESVIGLTKATMRSSLPRRNGLVLLASSIASVHGSKTLAAKNARMLARSQVAARRES